jgi:hypothetical protein
MLSKDFSINHLKQNRLKDRITNFTVKSWFTKKELLVLMAVVITVTLPAQAFGQAGTLTFTETGHHGNTLTDGDAGSINIHGISYNIYGLDPGGTRVGDILVLSYSGFLDTHYFFVDDGNSWGLPIDKLVIESDGGETFALKSFNVFDELGEAPDANYGTIWIPQGSSIHTGGGNTSLEAADNITLTNDSNNFEGIVSVIGAANLQITDQHELILGEISVSGTIDIAILGGDLTITDNISTTHAAENAIRIFADKNKSAGDPSGGNIKSQVRPMKSYPDGLTQIRITATTGYQHSEDLPSGRQSESEQSALDV